MEWPFVGRQGDLERLAAVMTSRSGGAALLIGPAGIGKTKLLGEAARRALAAGIEVHWVAGSQATQRVPLGAFAHLLGPGADPGDPVASLSAILQRLRGDARRRVALAVDDVNMLDPASATLLGHLAHGAPVSIAATMRVGDGPPPVWIDTRVVLAPLDEGEIAATMSLALGGPVDSGLTIMLTRLSEGNPLLLRELVDAGVASGVIVQRDGLWLADGPLVASETLPAAIAARIDRLTPDARAGGELIALGEPIGAALVEKVLSVEAIAALEAEGFLAPIPDRRRQSITIAHPLYGEALRAGVPPLRAREHRRRLADALEATGMRRKRDRMRVAIWRLEAGQRDDPALLLVAAREAAAASAHDLAVQLAEAAVESGAGLDAEFVLLEEMGYEGRADEALRRGEQLEAACADGETRARLAEIRADLLLIGSRFADADRVLLHELERTADTTVAARMRERRASTAFRAGLVSRAIELGEEVSIDQVPPGSAARTAMWCARALACAGRPGDGLDLIERVLSMLGEEGPAAERSVPLVTTALSQVTAFLGDPRSALAMVRRGLDASPIGASELRGRWTADMAQVTLMIGRPVSAERALREAATLLPPDRAAISATLWAHDALAEAMALLGRSEEASAAVERLEQLCPAGAVAPRRSGTVWAAAAGGELSRASDLAREHAEVLAEAGSVMLAAWTLHAAARLGADVADDVAALTEGCQGELAPLWARFCRGAASHDAEMLDDAGTAFAARGYDLWAADSFAAAASAHREAGRTGSALTSAARAEQLAAMCEGARTPLLAALDRSPVLTPREREIAGLAARGLADKDIAARLHLSVRTVHSHLYKVYRKLEIEDRSQLAGLF